MTADAYLPVWVYYLPIEFVCQPDGQVRDKVRRSVAMGVTRVVAGPLQCHVCVDVKRPYYRALPSVAA